MFCFLLPLCSFSCHSSTAWREGGEKQEERRVRGASLWSMRGMQSRSSYSHSFTPATLCPCHHLYLHQRLSHTPLTPFHA